MGIFKFAAKLGLGRSTARSVEPISPAEAHQRVLRGEAILVDVREADELERGMAQSAWFIATTEIQKQSPKWTAFCEQVPRDKVLIFYCAAGVRAGRAAKVMVDDGCRVLNMGGFDDWLAAGLPVQPGRK